MWYVISVLSLLGVIYSPPIYLHVLSGTGFYTIRSMYTHVDSQSVVVNIYIYTCIFTIAGDRCAGNINVSLCVHNRCECTKYYTCMAICM